MNKQFFAHSYFRAAAKRKVASIITVPTFSDLMPRPQKIIA
jgi:hypothetical protein